MNLVSTLGIDLAKSTFSLHGVNANGRGGAAPHALAIEAQ
jgi:hypothetical protein